MHACTPLSRSIAFALVFAAPALVSAQATSPYPSGPLVPSGIVVAHDDTAGNAAAMPASFPDKFAWTLFVQIVKPAAKQWPIGNNGAMTNNALFETWADDAWTFPSNPNPAQPPVWPNSAQQHAPKITVARSKHMDSHSGKAMLAVDPAQQGADVGKLPPGGFSVPNGGGVGEEVRRNKVAFDYIVQNGLWYRQGIAAFYQRAAAVANNELDFADRAVNFPRAAIEVKANWIVIDEKDKYKYHWNYNSAGQLLGLVAMHVISKDLPNWFWATFEHKDNPGRGDYIGIHDAFGTTPAHVPSNSNATGKVYPAGPLTPELQAMFKAAGLTGPWAAQWMNYRLKGSQVDFTDSAGRPLLLGNSVTEAGFVPTASCMTCHARAAVTVAGAKAYPIFGEQSMLPLVGVTNQGPTTYNGLPDYNWFFHTDGASSSPITLQTDFVWAIPMRAK